MRFTIRTFRGFQDTDSLEKARVWALEMVTKIASDGFDKDFQWANIEDNERRIVHVVRWMDNIAGF